jgi:glycine dehydrogenase subunit 2
VGSDLARYLPPPHILKDDGGKFRLEALGERSIGRLHAFYGNVGVLVRAYTYIRLQGSEGLRDIAHHSVLNANYMMSKLKNVFDVPFEGPCMHEFIVSLKKEARGASKIKALDVSKRLLDFGIHPPTNYFPLLVPECLLIEPTENESKRTLDEFIEAMIQIREEIDNDPEVLRNAPTTTPVGRVDEVRAARQLNVCCSFGPIEGE